MLSWSCPYRSENIIISALVIFFTLIFSVAGVVTQFADGTNIMGLKQ